MELENELDRVCAACWSDCGRFISLRDTYGFPVYSPWSLPPRCLGRVAVQQQLPKILIPGRVLHATMLGGKALFLHGYNTDGRFFLEIGNAETRAVKVLLEQVLPDYLIDVTPIIVLHNPERPCVQLVFLCVDRAPEVMIIPDTWTGLVEKCIDVASRYLLSDSKLKLHNLGHLLELEKNRREGK